MRLNPSNLRNGKEQHEYFHAPKRMGKQGPKLCQYDYRHYDGELFSCVGKTLDECRAKKSAWIERKLGNHIS